MKLDQVVPWGRSLREYEAFFRLDATDPDDLELRVLGCADGPASFNAEWTRAGGQALSIDPLYQFSADEIRERFEATVDDVIAQVEATPDAWSWTFHRDSKSLLETRREVMATFVEDFERGRGEGRYRRGALPALDLDDESFDLALSSHFLFLYSGHFSLDFHVGSMLELCRVAREVRVFPLLSLTRERSPHLDRVRSALDGQGYESAIERVDYELQKGGDEMLRVRRR